MKTASIITFALLFLFWCSMGRHFARMMWRDHCNDVNADLLHRGEKPPTQIVNELLCRGPTLIMWVLGLWRAFVAIWSFVLFPAFAVWTIRVAIHVTSTTAWMCAAALTIGCISNIVEHLTRIREMNSVARNAARRMFGDEYSHATREQQIQMESLALHFRVQPEELSKVSS